MKHILTERYVCLPPFRVVFFLDEYSVQQNLFVCFRGGFLMLFPGYCQYPPAFLRDGCQIR